MIALKLLGVTGLAFLTQIQSGDRGCWSKTANSLICSFSELMSSSNVTASPVTVVGAAWAILRPSLFTMESERAKMFSRLSLNDVSFGRGASKGSGKELAANLSIVLALSHQLCYGADK